MALSSSFPVIENNCQCRGQEPVSETSASMWLGLCTHCIDDCLPYHICSYWACDHIFIHVYTVNHEYFMSKIFHAINFHVK